MAISHHNVSHTRLQSIIDNYARFLRTSTPHLRKNLQLINNLSISFNSICINKFSCCTLSITRRTRQTKTSKVVPASDRMIKLWLNLCLYIFSSSHLTCLFLQRLSWPCYFLHGNFALQIQSAREHRCEKAWFRACRKFSVLSTDVNGDLIATLIYNSLLRLHAPTFIAASTEMLIIPTVTWQSCIRMT